MKKDAKYYLSRTNDLPYFLIDNLTELKNQVNLSRYIYSSVRELIERLELETDLDDFSKNTATIYLELNTLLEKHGMKLVPCFIPSNIKFDDRILVAIKPNLNNDEDFSYVQELIKSKRVPTQKDAAYISRMSSKIANYNIMLRVFESLHVISKKVDSHIRLELDNILCSLDLPKEGFNYLKACYSFSCLNDNFECNYLNQNLCFKKLDEKNHSRFISFMAKLALCNTDSYVVAKEFPYYDKLLLEISHQKSLIAQKEKQSEIEAIKEKEFKEHLKARVEEIAKLDAIDKNRRKLGVFASPSAIAKYQPVSNYKSHTEEVLLERTTPQTNYYQKKTSVRKNTERKLFIFDQNTEFNIYNFEQKYNLSFYSERSINKFSECFTIHNNTEEKGNLNILSLVSENSYAKKNKLLCNYLIELNNSLNLSDKFLELLTNTCKQVYIEDRKDTDSAILLNKIILGKFEYIHKFLPCIIPNFDRDNIARNKSELGITLNSVESRLFSGLYFYFLLILKEIFEPSEKALVEEILAELNNEFLRTNDYGLLFIRALHFIFFRLPEILDKSDESVDDVILADDQLLFAFYAYPQLVNSAIDVCLTQNDNIKTISDKNISVLFSLLQILLDKENTSNKLNQIRVPTVEHIFRLKLFIKLIRDNLYKYENIVSIKDNILENDESTLNVDFLLQNKGIHQNIQESVAAFIASHESFVYLFSPLLKNKLHKNIVKTSINYDLQNCVDQTKKILNKNKHLILAILQADKPDLLLKLINNELDMKDQMDLIGKLNNLLFDNLNSVINIIDPKCSPSMAGCIEKGIMNLGLMSVPIEQALPVKERCNLKQHKIIQTEVDSFDSKVITEEFYEKLACAQNAFIIYSYIVVENCAERNLIKIIKPENDLQEKFALKFFTCLKHLIRGNPRYTKAYYARLAKSINESSTLELTIEYLNTLINEEMKIHPLASYFTNILSETLKPLLQTGISSRNNISPITQKKFSINDFDESKISSKLNESNHIQTVIESIRITEGSLKEDEDLEYCEQDSPSNDDNKEKQDTNVTNLIKLPSESAKNLIDAISKHDSDIMDLNEFNGLCLSFKYMSKDVAIEEINDFCYENYDEPLFDVDYEGNAVYITTDILNLMKN